MCLLVGSRKPPEATWPHNAKIAVSFVLNYEEGGEKSVDLGDETSETYLTEIYGTAEEKKRNPVVETNYEYGSRVGVWRILQLFENFRYPLTIYAVGKALELNPDVGKSFVQGGHEVASHAYRWHVSAPFLDTPEDIQREKSIIRQGIKAIQDTTGQAPRGWYFGRFGNGAHAILRQVYEEDGLELKYVSDAYNDDRPYYQKDPAHEDPLLIVPYSLDCNDMRWLQPNGVSSAADFTSYLTDAFDCLYEEGCKGTAVMMSIGLHCRITGKPGRLLALRRFLEYVQSKEDAWVCTREEIADHWRLQHPFEKKS